MTMTEPQKQKIIDEVLSEFDFERVHAIRTLCRKYRDDCDKTIKELRASAEMLLRLVLEHTDREVWWAYSGGFFCYYDHNHGICLQYVTARSRISRTEIRQIEIDDKLKPEEND